MKQGKLKLANSKTEGYFTNKVNAFTLIELLAIIVILAIIAVITVPIILNVIDNARKGAAIDSAYGYTDSIYKGFLTELSLDPTKELPTGTYVIDSTGTLVNTSGILNTNISGNTPEEFSWVQLNKGQVIAYSLKFEDYTVTKYSDTEPTAVKNGEIAESAEAREARLEVERQTTAKANAYTLATSQTGTTGITDITEGWVGFINGELKAYSIKVTVEGNTYVVTNLNVESTNENATANKGATELASKSSTEEAIVSYKVDTYVKDALTKVTVSEEEAYTVADMTSVTTNPADSGWIHFKKENSTVTVMDYSLTYGEITANYSSLTSGNYVSTFGTSRNKPSFVTVGSPVCYGPTGQQECFKIIKIFIENNIQKAMLLADNNLKKDTTTNPVTYKQDASSPDTIAFSGSDYWMDTTTSPYTLKSTYSNNGAYSYDSTNNKFVDTSSNQVYPNIYDSNSLTYTYVEGYLETLKTATYGLPSGATGRLLTNTEAADTTMFANDAARKNGKSYWLGSALNSAYVRRVIGSNGGINNIVYDRSYGVRPVIIISTSDISS